MPFGEELSPDSNYRKSTDFKYGQTDSVRQRFTGYQKDSETGLDFAEARMYENRHGRFTAVDPLLASGKSANPQTFNRFVYCLNNPLAFTDPSGLQAGDWYYPADENGHIIVPGKYKYINKGESTDGYRLVTLRNRAGDLIGYSDDLPDGYVVRFNPNGPMPSDTQRTMILTHRIATPFEIDGYETIMSDELKDHLYKVMNGDVNAGLGTPDVSLELFLALEGGVSVIRGVGKFAAEARIATQATERSAVVTEKGLNIVKDHLAQFPDDAGNAGMVERLENAMANGGRVTGADRSFYMHELKESTMMKRGVPYDEAHPGAIQWDKVSPFELYHPDIIRQNPTIFSPGFKQFWEGR